MTPQPPAKSEDTGAVPQISDIVYRLHGRAFLDGEVPNMDYPKEAIAKLEALIQQRELAARIDERKRVAVNNYQGHTFSESTNWRGKFKKFMDNNKRRIAELERQQTEVMKGEKA